METDKGRLTGNEQSVFARPLVDVRTTPNEMLARHRPVNRDDLFATHQDGRAAGDGEELRCAFDTVVEITVLHGLDDL